MNNSKNGEWTEVVPKKRERSEPIDYTIDLGEQGVYYMTKGLYEFLIDHGYDIPEKFHSMYESDQLHNNTQEEINNNYNGTYGNNINNYAIRKTSGRMARNKKTAYSGKKNKSQKKSLNFFKNKRSKRRAQVMAPLNNLRNTVEAAYNNTYNNTEDQDFIKLWALNCLVGAIENSSTLDQLETYLNMPISDGLQSQNKEMIAYKTANNIKIPKTILRNYFETPQYINRSSIDKFHKLIEEELPYGHISLYENKFWRNYHDINNSDEIPLIDAESTTHYTITYSNNNNSYYSDHSRRYYLKPLISALSRGNRNIINKIISFKPSLEKTLIDIYNNYKRLNISLDNLILLSSKIDFISIKTIKKIVLDEDNEAFSKFFVALVYNDNFLTKVRSIIDNVFINLFGLRIRYNIDDDNYRNVLEHLKSKNLKPSNELIVDTLVKVLEDEWRTGFYPKTEDLLEYLVTIIDPNISLDGEANTVLMALLRTRHSNEAGLITHLIDIILQNPDFDPNRRNQLGETAFAIAIRMGRKDVAERLMRDRRTNLEAKNVYGTKIINSLRRGIAAPNAAAMEAHAAALAAAPPPPPQENNFNWNAWANNQPPPPPPPPDNNNNNNITTGRTTRRNNYRNMMRTFERAIKPRVAMTMSAKRVGRRQAQVGPNLGRYITSFVPSAVPPAPNNE